MVNMPTVFEYNDSPVRSLLRDGEPWFVASDIADVLGLGRVHDAVRGLDEDEKGADSIRTPGGNQQVTVINEAGLYSLILRSRKPEAKVFKRWVTHEVLPAIRRHGGYLTEQKLEEALLSPDTLIKLASNLKAEQERRRQLEAQLEADRPAVEYVERFVAQHDDAITVRDAAADLGVKESVLRQALLDLGWIYRKDLGQRFSAKKQQVERVYEYRAYAEKQPYFVLRPQHNAPRHHNGQVKQTLYVTPAGLQAMARIFTPHSVVSDGVGEVPHQPLMFIPSDIEVESLVDSDV